jgi:transcriptional regulator with XRE-family HTH domain
LGLTGVINLPYIYANMTEFSSQLRALRTKRKIGIKSLARDLGVSYTYISHLERGRAKPSAELIKKLAAYFQVDEDDLNLAIGKLPADVEKILYEHPREVVMLLRESFATILNLHKISGS